MPGEFFLLSTFNVGPFTLLLLALPVLLLGEQLVKRIAWIRNSHIPAAIVGGLLVAVAILIAQEVRPGLIAIYPKSDNPVWHWFIVPRWKLVPESLAIEQPLLILFFTCIGLNASWSVAKKGGVPLLIFLALASAFVIVQNGVGALIAKAMHQNPLLGVMCGGVTLMGGFGTARGFAPVFEDAGLHGASTIGVISAAFGVILGGLLAGPIAGRLIAKKVRPRLDSANQAREFEVVLPDSGEHPTLPFEPSRVEDVPKPKAGFVADVLNITRHWRAVLMHFALLLICLKAGVFLGAWIGSWKVAGQKVTFPIYLGSMLVAAGLRSAHDLAGLKWIDSLRVDLIASVCLAWLLSVVMIGLQLNQLAHSALPMLVILAVQVVLMAVFVYWVVFRVMGRDYEAAMMSAGLFGFGIGATSNALASMNALRERFGPAPRAFLTVTIVGAFLIDFTNAILITLSLNLLK